MLNCAAGCSSRIEQHDMSAREPKGCGSMTLHGPALHDEDQPLCRKSPIISLRSTLELAVRFSRYSALRRHGHVAQACSRGGKDRVADRRRQAHEARFARSCRGQVLAVDEYDLDLRGVTEPGNAILREMGIQNAAISKENPFEEGAADALNNGARKLVAQAVGIHDGAALP